MSLLHTLEVEVDILVHRVFSYVLQAVAMEGKVQLALPFFIAIELLDFVGVDFVGKALWHGVFHMGAQKLLDDHPGVTW